jgi:amino acid transporter
MFLLTFTLVNLSLVVLRKRAPEIRRRYRVPLFPWVPLTAAVLNVFLAVYQFNFDPMSWYVALGWILIGLLAYLLYFEKQSGEAAPQVLDALKRFPERRIVYLYPSPIQVQCLLCWTFLSR